MLSPATRHDPLPTAKTAVAAALLGLVAAWVAAGDAGLLGHPLRHALTWLLLATATLAWGGRWSRRNILTLLAVVPPTILLTASSQVTLNILAVALFLAVLSIGADGPTYRPVQVVSETVLVLAVFHFLRTSVPIVWQAADAVGAVAGKLVGGVTGRPLAIGASFAGLDYLVTGTYLAVMLPLRHGCSPARRPWRKNPLVRGLFAVGSAHIVYLTLLSLTVPCSASFLQAERTPAALVGDVAPTSPLPETMRHLMPWNAPLLALILYAAAIAWLLMRTAKEVAWRNDLVGRNDMVVSGLAPSGPSRSVPRPSSGAAFNRATWVFLAAVLMLAGLLPWTLTPARLPPSLEGKTIVFYEKGYVNWLKPRHGDYGQYSAGMYGMLPVFVESLGARAIVAPELTGRQLRRADVLVLIFPDQPWREGQLEGIWEFVRDGGVLLVMGEHTARGADGGSRFHEVLRPTGIRVQFDSAMFAVGGWLQSYEPLRHVITHGISDAENEFGVVIGASLDARPPARPILVGRYGWADPGDPSSPRGMMGNGRYDAGEKLGDLVLAAEQRVGKGRVVVFGDTSTLSNSINVGGHEFTARLFGYLARSGVGDDARWWSWCGTLLGCVLLVLVAWRGSRPVLLAAPLALAASLIAVNWHAETVPAPLPRPAADASYRLAYIDATHLETYSRELWRDDGLMGLGLTLIRNGYQTYLLREFREEQLEAADLLISVAPQRAFSPRELRLVHDFVRRGGTLIVTVGRDDAGPSDGLLKSFGFHATPASETGMGPPSSEDFPPLGHFKTVYGEGPPRFVRFHAAWPVYCDDEQAEVVTFHPPAYPLIIVRRLGDGRVVAIGDTAFAMNKNLESPGGGLIEGLRENADFWQWLLQDLREDSPARFAPTDDSHPASSSNRSSNTHTAASERESPP